MKNRNDTVKLCSNFWILLILLTFLTLCGLQSYYIFQGMRTNLNFLYVILAINIVVTVLIQIYCNI